MPVKQTYHAESTGFTLLELLVVLAIIGLLAGIAAPLYLGRADQARVQKAQTDLATIASALSLYRFDNTQLPTTEQGLEALTRPSDLPPKPLRFKPGAYLKQVPVDPWGNAYRYLQPGRNSEQEFDLYSLGADGKNGGSDLDADISL